MPASSRAIVAHSLVNYWRGQGASLLSKPPDYPAELKLRLWMLKRLFDIVVSTIGLILLSPVMLIVAIWIRIDSLGPVFYRGERGGRANRPFRIFKFRSMVSNADRVGGPTTSNDDARITRPGAFIRRHKLDEVAQLINVWLGEMSIVGPRPQVLSYTSGYAGEFAEILTVRPGITDWATIWNSDEGAVLAGAADPDRAYDILINPTKLRLQLRYVRERSFRTDLRIVYCTLRRMFDPHYYPKELGDVRPLIPGAGALV
jgi:lipopolysaccharide/colanic/teichoic acid biosynthesis glycosyltransferase